MSVAAEVTVARARNFVDGKWIEASGGRVVERRNPANSDDLVGLIPFSTRDEARAAIAVAQRAFPAWRNTPAPLRGKIIARACQIMAEEIDELAAILTREEGKTLAESRGEILRSINVLEFMAGEGRRLIGETLPSELPKNFAYTVKQPLVIREGVEQELGKKIVRLIKDSKMKAQASIQGDVVRVSSPKKDTLQEVITLTKKNITDVPLQYRNFRD